MLQRLPRLLELNYLEFSAPGNSYKSDQLWFSSLQDSPSLDNYEQLKSVIDFFNTIQDL